MKPPQTYLGIDALPDVEGPLLTSNGSESGTGNAPEKRKLPPVVSAADLLNNPPPLPQELVEGIIHEGTKIMLAGPAKANKTWALLDLSVAIATGGEWWGFNCHKAPVLYLNYELSDSWMARRLDQIARSRNISPEAFRDTLRVWNLRGHNVDIDKTAGELAQEMKWALITILDPVYKMLGDRDENNNGQIADLLNRMGDMINVSGSSVTFAHHFAKGGAAGKYAIDRMSGAGAWARDPDSIIVLTPHEDEDAFVAEFILRNFAPQDSFVVRKEHPHMVRDYSLDPEKLKQPGGKSKRTVDEILDEIPEGEGIAAGEWQKRVSDNKGISRSRFYELLREAKTKGKIYLSTLDDKYYIK